jgi:prolipoprotein diacylglyceryltransferase
VFSKIFEFVLDKEFEEYPINQMFNIKVIVTFILCGYTFFGGYVGSVLAIFAIKKKMKLGKEICFWFINNLNLMYAIMKIHCFLKGCCYGFTIIPTQLLESLISFFSYITMIIIYKKSKKANMCTGLSIVLFSVERFIISFFRAYMTDLAFIGTEVVCVILMILGSIIFLKNIKEKL